MDEEELFYQVAFLNLTIPVWQVALFIIIISVSMLMERHKVSLVTTYLFTLYWGFFLSWGHVISSFSKFPTMATLYLLCGMLHVTLTLIAFFKGE